MESIKNYELVCGLEVHAELLCKTKIFCSCPTDFGGLPNSHCCPVCMGMPGALPVLNRHAVELAVRAGLALDCRIANESKFDRKNYFYPDLPKAYQISQFDKPLCVGGHLTVETSDGTKDIGITRIHIEEDAGKLIHDGTFGTLIDCNRCGVPLIEIVTEPDIRSAEEAAAFVKKLRSVLVYAGVTDGKMNEGSLRCDVNLSVRKIGETNLGVRTEMKNLSSFAYIAKAVEYEYRRQVDVIESGGKIDMETRRFDEQKEISIPMRKKETADDYRFFPEPDLPPFAVSDSEIAEIRSEMPLLPDEMKAKFLSDGLTAKDADKLIDNYHACLYYLEAVKTTAQPKLLANLLLGEVFAMFPEGMTGTCACETKIPISPHHLAVLADFLGDGRINSTTAKKLVRVLWDSDCDPAVYIEEHRLAQIRDPDILRKAVTEAIAENQSALASYRAGKVSAAKVIMGKIMAKTGGRGDPVMIQRILEEYL